MAETAQCAMLQLEIDGIIFSNLTTYFLNMAVTEFAHATVVAAQEILIEVEYRYIEDIEKLFFQASSIGGDPAQFGVSRDQSEPWTGFPTGRSKPRPIECDGGEERRSG
jgi:hypothetical protein